MISVHKLIQVDFFQTIRENLRGLFSLYTRVTAVVKEESAEGGRLRLQAN